jgi:glycosyltransferase involved in cell wall biosynthesis
MLWEQIKTDKVELDVYSSTQIYGDAFKNQTDKQFTALYDKAKSMKNVNYKGYLNHKELMKVLHTYDAYVHPSTFEETFCVAAMESLAAGLVVVTTDLELCMKHVQNFQYIFHIRIVRSY